MGVIFVSMWLLARGLGAEGYGEYTYAYSAALLISMAAQLGTPALLVRELSAYEARGDWSHWSGVVRRSFQVVIINSLALALLCLAVLMLNVDVLDESQIRMFSFVLVLFPLQALIDLIGGALRGMRRITLGQFVSALLSPLIFLIIIITLYFVVDKKLTPLNIIMIQFTASALAFVIGLAIFVRSIPPESKATSPMYRTKSWLHSILLLSLGVGMDMILKRSDILILGIYFSYTDVGIYQVVSQLIIGGTVCAQSIYIATGPKISQLFALGNVIDLQKLVTASCRGGVLLVAPVALIYLLGGGELLGFLFGEAYIIGWVALSILIVGKLLTSMTGGVSVLLNMTGLESEVAKNIFFGALINLVLNLIFIPRYGLVAAAFSSAVSYIICSAGLWHAARTKLNINSLVFKIKHD
jgi:O-antigen/teichoic acid export membrane protein